MVLISTNEKHFPKTISQWECDYGLFTNLPRIIVPCDFSEFIQTQKRYPIAWQNMYPNLKTTSHIKLKFFLWTKLLENLLLAVAPLKTSKNEKPNIFQEIGIPEIHVQLFENFEFVWCYLCCKNRVRWYLWVTQFLVSWYRQFIMVYGKVLQYCQIDSSRWLIWKSN